MKVPAHGAIHWRPFANLAPSLGPLLEAIMGTSVERALHTGAGHAERPGEVGGTGDLAADDRREGPGNDHAGYPHTSSAISGQTWRLLAISCPMADGRPDPALQAL